MLTQEIRKRNEMENANDHRQIRRRRRNQEAGLYMCIAEEKVDVVF